MKTVVVVPPLQFVPWKSLRTILDSLVEAWLAIADKKTKVTVVSAVPGSLFRHAALLRAAERVVFPHHLFKESYLDVLRRQIRATAPVVIHTHGEAMAGFQSYEEPTVRLFRRDDLFLCASRAEAKAVKACFPRAQVEIFPFPILRDEELLQAGADETGPLRFVYAGRISDQKRIDVLIRALYWLKTKGRMPEASLDLFGVEDFLGGPLWGAQSTNCLADLKRLVRKLGLENSVHWRGTLPAGALQKFHFSPATCFVSASTHWDEDFGLAALEALSQGSRLVLSAWGGHLDWKREFPKWVETVSVSWGKQGLEIAPESFGRSMLKSARRKPPLLTRKRFRAYVLPQASVRLKKIIGRTDRAKKPILASTLVFDCIAQARRMNQTMIAAGLRIRRLFRSPGEDLAFRLAKSYGANRKRSAR